MTSSNKECCLTPSLWYTAPWPSRSRSMTNLYALSEISTPTHSRFSLSAATQVVAHPQNGSKTTSPRLLDILIIRLIRSKGFCVGYHTRSLFGAALMSVHRLFACFPDGSLCFLYTRSFAKSSSPSSSIRISVGNVTFHPLGWGG